MTDSSPDVAARREADLRGDPYLLYRDRVDRQRIVILSGGWDRATVGRDASNDLSLNWDPEVSRVHAQLDRIGDDWTLVDEGLSRNGSFVNGERLSGRRRLADGDELRFGNTTVVFRAPFQVGQETLPTGGAPA
jgi:pSer/pThr/pTyr-binding forkhead associated (FHA) protein